MSKHLPGLLIPGKRSELSFSSPHLLPALSCLFRMLSRFGLQWHTCSKNKYSTVLSASFIQLSEVNDVTEKEWQQCECEELGTCGFLLTSVPGLPQANGKTIHSEACSFTLGFQLIHQVSHLFRRRASLHQCLIPGEDGMGMCQTHVQLEKRQNIGSHLGISTSSYYFQFLASPCPSWGSPQLLQGLPGGVPSFPRAFLGSPQ